jgi:hypothetical protein
MTDDTFALDVGNRELERLRRRVQELEETVARVRALLTRWEVATGRPARSTKVRKPSAPREED